MTTADCGTGSHVPFALPERPAATRIRQVDKAVLLDPPGTRTMPMAGFEDKFVDIVDYIVRITEEIWTDRAIGRIYDTYDAGCTVYSSYGVVRSVEEVIASTIGTMAAFPEEEAHHLNVAWSGDERQGFYTSHLGWTRMINRGASVWGPATGVSVGRRFAADCISRDNRIHTEWLVHDAGALVRQLGLGIDEAATIIAARPLRERAFLAPPARQSGQLPPAAFTGERDSPEGWMRGHFHDLWTLRRLDRLRATYAPEAVAHWAGGRVASGPHNIGTLIIETMASLPDAAMQVHNVCWSDETDGVIVAVRWELTGMSRRGGLLGERLPEGRLVSVPGISHFRFSQGLIVEEWTVFDEVAAIAQTLTPPACANEETAP
ncbi:ester cyclase [Blastomonas sp. UPD001]|uniref:nuclear transport factor 2 family protein n=1 Tax=Blastomonas sp. UPD001 TaxID=2217673 RepID=UPI0013009C14|nr:ester cyclase [Blastomonas sp. UPD001]